MCETCGKTFHLQCLDPPLAKKPGLGFGWSCAVCYQKREDEYEAYIAGNGASPPTSAVMPGRFKKGKGKARDGMRNLRASFRRSLMILQQLRWLRQLLEPVTISG